MNTSDNLCCPPDAAKVFTVQSVAGIKGLNNCFVRVLDNNTVYFVDKKHHITVISSQVVEVDDYDYEKNQLNLRDQIAYDRQSGALVYFDVAGKPHYFDPNASVIFDKIKGRPTYNGEPLTSETNIPKVPETISELGDGGRVEHLERSVAQLDELAAKLDLEVATGVTADAEVSAVALTTHLTDLVTGLESTAEAEFPMATANKAGAITAADYAKFQHTADQLAAISGSAVAIADLPEDVSQAQLTQAWKEATGEDELVNGASVRDTSNGKLWTYYANTEEWVATTTDMPLWTGSTPGAVKSGSQDGELGAQEGGTGKVVGWDEQAATIKSHSDTLNEYAESLNEIDVKIADLEEKIDSGAEVPERAKNLPEQVLVSSENNVTQSNNNLILKFNVLNLDTGQRLTSSFTTFPAATSTSNGIMTAADKAKLDSIDPEAGGGKLYSEYGQNEDGALTQKFVSDKLNANSIALGGSASSNGTQSVALGYQSSASGTVGVAIGSNAVASRNDSVALGRSSRSYRDNEVSIGSGTTSYSPATRYLANVKDGELPQDACTVNQLNTAVGDVESILARLSDGAGV